MKGRIGSIGFRAKVVINWPFRAAFEATIKSHERDQRSDTTDRVRIVEAIGLRIGLCAGALSIRTINNIRWLIGVLAEGVGFEPTVPLQARRFSRLVPRLISSFVLYHDLALSDWCL